MARCSTYADSIAVTGASARRSSCRASRTIASRARARRDSISCRNRPRIDDWFAVGPESFHPRHLAGEIAGGGGQQALSRDVDGHPADVRGSVDLSDVHDPHGGVAARLALNAATRSDTLLGSSPSSVIRARITISGSCLNRDSR